VTEEEVLVKIQERDNRDMTRTDGPLRKPEGAYEIDTGHSPVEHQIENMYAIIQEVLQKKTNLA
jgi:cytidylate kinase